MEDKKPRRAYKDPTADMAIGNVMREEKYKKKLLAKKQKRQIGEQDRRCGENGTKSS